MNWAELLQALQAQQGKQPNVSGYANYMPSRLAPGADPNATPPTAQGDQSMQMWTMFMQDPMLRAILLQALAKGQGASPMAPQMR